MDVITELDVYRSCPALKPKDRRDDIVPTMRVLELEGWIRPSRWEGNKPKTWAINPAVHGAFADRAEIEREHRKTVQHSIHREASARRVERLSQGESA